MAEVSLPQSMAEAGRLLMGNLTINDPSPPTNNAQRRLSKRQISAHSYAMNTPTYDLKLQRVNFVGARKPGVVPAMWSTQEDLNLRASVAKHGEKNWRVISDEIPGRNHLQCLQRWKKALKPGLVKGHWSKEEDQELLDLIKPYTIKQTMNKINWASIANQIEGRNAKQCRERWFLNLDPSINRGPWTASEDRQLLELAAQCGGRWSLISKNMVGRTENSVKTRYHALQRQEARSRGWTAEEDANLLNAALVFGKDWAKVVKQLPGRSRGQLKKRFAVIVQHRPDLVKQVQIVEEQLARGLITAPNPPPPAIQPIGAKFLQANLEAQQQGQRPGRAPVVSPYVPPMASLGANSGNGSGGIKHEPMFNNSENSNNSQYFSGSSYNDYQQQPSVIYFDRNSAKSDNKAAPQLSPSNSGSSVPAVQPKAPPKKSLSRRYGSSWMQGFVDNLTELNGSGASLFGTGAAMPPSSASAGSGTTAAEKSLPRTNSQKMLHDLLGSNSGNATAGSNGKTLNRNNETNLALLDKLLLETSSTSVAGGNNANASDRNSEKRSKGLKQYNSWGSIGNSANNDFGLFTDTTAGGAAGSVGSGALRTGSSLKELQKMGSSINLNWNIPNLGTYESVDMKNFINML